MKNKKSLLTKLLIIFMTVILLQASVAVVLTVALGIVQSQYKQAYSSVNFIVTKKVSQINSMFNDISANIVLASADYGSYINGILAENNADVSVLSEASDLTAKIFTEKAIDLTHFLYANPDASGVFLIFSDTYLSDDNVSKPCLYIRKRTLETNFYTTENYWVLKYGPQAVAKILNLQLDYLWDYNFKLPDDALSERRDFFNKPFESALKALDQKSNFYISKPFYLDESTKKIVTQTIPLLDENGRPYGIFGVEMSISSIEKALSSPELPNVTNGFYLITDNEASDFSNTYIYGNPQANVFLNLPNIEVSTVDIDYNIYKYSYNAEGINDMLSCFLPLHLYNSSSEFINEKYVLYGFVPQDQLLKNSESIRDLSIYVGVIFFIFSVIAAVLASVSVTKPILRLSEQVANIDADMPITLKPTGIFEIDRLSDALEKLSANVAQSASRLSSIITLFEKPIGGYEENIDEDRVYLTDSLFKIFDIPINGNNFISYKSWAKILAAVTKNKTEKYPDVFKYVANDNSTRYLQLNTKKETDKSYGVIIDVTTEVLEKQRLEYERDVDSLTKLLNRSAFNQKASEALRMNYTKASAVLFIDIDNLKYINDNYGHEYGDDYIKLMSNVLTNFLAYNAIIARISGDEFSVLLYGYNSYDEIRQIYKKVFQLTRDSYIKLPDYTYHKLRYSCGVSWYPKDSRELPFLIKYADYAMYEVKHTSKGDIKEFDVVSYTKNSFLTDKLEVLNALIEDELMYLVFQPIVESTTGKIYAYEALMRSTHIELSSPLQIIQLAKAQSKLYLLEKKLLLHAINYVKEHKEMLGERKVFFNTVASVLLTDNDFDDIEFLNDNNILAQMVMEITETDQGYTEQNIKKVSKMRSFGMQIAIDDYGSGYSNELTLISLNPDYIKVDMNIIRNIDQDNNKQQLLRNLISYAKSRNMKLVAEGIETDEELKTLAHMGVDLYQGFILYRPSPTFVPDSDDIIKLVTEFKNQ